MTLAKVFEVLGIIRNRLRYHIVSKQKRAKPIPLTNRTELIKAINQLKEIAQAYMWKQGLLDQVKSGYIVNTITKGEIDGAYKNYQEADKHLQEESLIAGTSFEPSISLFSNKVKLHVWIRYYGHENQPDWTQVLTELDNATKECIKAIDGIQVMYSIRK